MNKPTGYYERQGWLDRAAGKDRASRHLTGPLGAQYRKGWDARDKYEASNA